MSHVYVAGSLLHLEKEKWKFYEDIANVVENSGFSPYLPHIHTLEGKDIDSTVKGIEPDPVFVFNRNKEIIENAALVVAEVTNLSIGTGIEIGMALMMKKPVICLVHKGAKITRMVRGPAEMGLLDLIYYENESDCLRKLGEKLRATNNY